ncbi:isochorismatase family cysteine hydrolase [Amycolatopsis dongchuanensis]|uniref:Cysteine hydrolase n=1 Tax=Amycolatopsis dongchuanensis TaxID=1070866 RepID=A0ABP9PVN9_9PSEU
MTNTALLVMDLQQAIASRVPDPDYVPRLAGAVRAARAAGLPVVHVVLGFRAGHPEGHPRNKTFGALPEGAFTDQDPGAAIVSEVAPEPGEIVVTKKRVSAFTGSDLRLVLDARGIEHLVLTGVATRGVVLSTLRQAADLDYRLTVLSDGCADPEPDVHRFLVERIFPQQADVLTIEDWTKTL